MTSTPTDQGSSRQHQSMNNNDFESVHRIPPENGGIETHSVTSHKDHGENDSVAYGKAVGGERKAVNASKCCFFAILVIASAIIAGATYHFTKQSQMKDYEHSFRIYAEELTDVANTNAFSHFGMVSSMGISITSYVLDSAEASWPLVTVPHFEAMGADARKVSGAERIAFTPIVYSSDKAAWENYAINKQTWIADSLNYVGLNDTDPGPISTEIVSSDTAAEFYVPIWEVSPPPTNASIVNMDLMANARMRDVVNTAMTDRREVLSGAVEPVSPLVSSDYDVLSRSFIVEPVFENFASSANVVGFIIAVLPWTHYFENVLPEGTNGVMVHVDDGCGFAFTCRIDGPKATFMGMGDLHDHDYDSQKLTTEFAVFDKTLGNNAHAQSVTRGVASECAYSITVYPSEEFESLYKTNAPLFFTCLVVMVFLTTVFLFILYDWFNRMRQKKAISTAAHTNAIVSSLFPKDVQKRIIEEAEEAAMTSRQKGTKGKLLSNKYPMDPFDDDETHDKHASGDKAQFKNKPIADLYLSVTVMFADIVGFAAWSATREPAQVFTLLETIYHAFDQIAKRRRVFKVETVGECYVAVCGLPDERKDHAVVMARFARDCLYQFGTLTKDLETILGPDIGDLGVRFGLHSGQVTAGVLRGERARFQLFGDTMNTTARIESTGERNRIHVSQETADLLTLSGKQHWVAARERKVYAKGKGEMQTYWLLHTQEHPSTKLNDVEQMKIELETGEVEVSAGQGVRSDQGFSVAEAVAGQQKLSEKQMRLVQWTSDVLGRMLKEVVANREATRIFPDPHDKLLELERMENKDKSVLSEVTEVIDLAHFTAVAADKRVKADRVELGDCVTEQIESYVRHIAVMYRNNPFHNFEHACHVAMSVKKLLSRIVNPTTEIEQRRGSVWDKSLGITSDPLTQFALVLSALIHDVDHPGVPNSQLVKEGTNAAAAYKNRCVAEQNSIDLAWNLLMDSEFLDLRSVIYTTESEFKRFRQFLVNAVMATDMQDKEMNALRVARWAKEFDTSSGQKGEMDKWDINRKATLVIEYLMQAADVAYTMQHWHIYRKWNARLFYEMQLAYKESRAESDPVSYWYENEIAFFDNTIIPLAKKLRSCNVFEVSSDEYLNYAQQNREEWQLNGREIVAELVEELNQKRASGGA